MKEFLQQNFANRTTVSSGSSTGGINPESEEIIQKLRKQLEEINDQLTSTTRKLAEKTIELETTQKSQRAVEMERDELVGKVKSKVEEVERVNKEMSALRIATADFDSRLASSQARCELQDTTIKELRDTLVEREKTIGMMREKLMDDELQRRKLHNTIQDLKGNIRVFCRIRPSQTKDGEKMYVLDSSDPRKLDVVEAGTSATGKKQQTKHAFTYDHVFGPASSQEDVFEELSMFVQSVLDGYSCCVFAYGQTGSGKTYTMEGPSVTPVSGSSEMVEDEEIKQGSPDRGVIPRTVELLFKSMNELELRGWKYTIDVRFLEVYNEQIRDLLAKGSSSSSVKIQHEANGKTNVTGCITVPVSSPDAVYALIKTARAARAVAATRYNDYSSRSHSVFQLYLHGHNEQRRESVESVLNLVDLAGSERLSATMPATAGEDTSARQKETLNINLSLMNLRKVITALAAKQAHIPYRESVLTQLLQNALGGECKMLMFVNVSPEPANVSQSLSSLKFASTANKCVTGVVQRHAQKGAK